MKKQREGELYVRLSEVHAKLNNIKKGLKAGEAYCPHCNSVYQMNTSVCNCDKIDLNNLKNPLYDGFIPAY